MQHHEAVESYKQADIVVDQLLIGWYGMLAQECMALGKPVCVYIREDLEQYMPFCPFLKTTTKNLVDNLRLLIEDSSLRMEMAKKGRDYVEKVHEANMVARMVTKYYE
jgi:glycosyltransferase involved in cell wall biosynthesis